MTYAQRLAQERQTYLSIGEEFGQQRVIDAICLALRDKDVMGKNMRILCASTPNNKGGKDYET